ASGSAVTFAAPNVAEEPNPSSAYLSAPNSSLISQSNAFDGTNSCRIQWQWSDASNIRWAHILATNTTGKVYPQIDTTKPITVRYLVLPVGQTTNKLHFTSLPVSQTKTTNDAVTFSVVATGEGPFTYQWQFAGTDISGATNSSYTKTNVQLADAGTYSITVTGAGGTGCSASVSANLSVTESAGAPTITYSLNGNQLTLNWVGTFNLESKTNLNQASWSNVGVNTGPYVTTVTNAATFYRLHNP
ncbi:MAG: immunoglobulin domain-containing protein, partial [Verrucomicrobiota bacterium]|nr:immunoglobulin domain-containing protein [Verrucomicrobiota bacterium]